MKAQRMKPTGLALVLTLTLLGTASTAFAHGSGMMSGSMPGMGDNDHHERAAQGHGMGYGSMMEPGMMGQGFMGSGMMGPGMMGQGMMGGCSPMHGYDGMSQALDLNDDQQKKISQIQQDFHRQNWDLMGKMYDESLTLRRLFHAAELDPKAIGEQQQRLFDLRRQMTEAWVETQNHIKEILTPEQKAKLQQFSRQGMMGW
jgi:Spy/CpxP family protein refolding chaperone